MIKIVFNEKKIRLHQFILKQQIVDILNIEFNNLIGTMSTLATVANGKSTIDIILIFYGDKHVPHDKISRIITGILYHVYRYF